jgi:putative N6-adenine-specific DNA methylase
MSEFSLFTKKSKILVTCPKGIPPYLAAEIRSLGFPVLKELTAAVETEGTLNDSMVMNLMLRTGHRVLFLVHSFNAHTADDLYNKLTGIGWEDYISEDAYFRVTAAVENPNIRDSRFAVLKTKDAVVDRIRVKRGRRPNSGSEQRGAAVFLYWRGISCNVFLDTSGDPLSRRGYRKIPVKAPMQESLAASTILATGWNGSGHFINPMCGSGTLAIEAALIALDKAPGLLRSAFAFQHLRGFDREAWQSLRRSARQNTRKELDWRIIAGDHDAETVRSARQNARTAGVDHLLEFHVCDFRKTPIPEGYGIVMINPEYGKRLGELKSLTGVYKNIGDFFKQSCQGFRGYIFTGNLDLAKQVGLRTKRRLPFFNGEIECRLLEYETYSGSRKNSS